MCCNHNCNQGRSCTARKSFNGTTGKHLTAGKLAGRILLFAARLFPLPHGWWIVPGACFGIWVWWQAYLVLHSLFKVIYP